MRGVMAVVFPSVAYQVPPSLLPAAELATTLNVSNFEFHGLFSNALWKVHLPS